MGCLFCFNLGQNDRIRAFSFDFKSNTKMENLSEIKKLLESLLKRLEEQNPCPEIRRDWIPKQELQMFLGFANTQMAAHEKKYNWVYTSIGKQKFYSTKSVSNILNQNISA